MINIQLKDLHDFFFFKSSSVKLQYFLFELVQIPTVLNFIFLI